MTFRTNLLRIVSQRVSNQKKKDTGKFRMVSGFVLNFFLTDFRAREFLGSKDFLEFFW